MASYRYLLDTNILSSLIKQPSGPVASRIATAGEDLICTSILVACELALWCSKEGGAAAVDRCRSR